MGGLPFSPSPLGGNIGALTASIFRLDPLGVAPLEPILDLVPGITPLRVTLDCVDGEQFVCEYEATEHPIQDIADVTSNIRKKLKSLTITGTLGATMPVNAAGVPPPPGAFVRLDLIRMKNLQTIADSKALVMVVTPRVSLAKCIITSLSSNWSPDDGESTIVTMSFREVRVVSPLIGASIAPDYPAQLPGNNAATGGGQSVASESGATVTRSAVPGVAPSLGPATAADASAWNAGHNVGEQVVGPPDAGGGVPLR